MALIRRVASALESLAPLALAESWDNTGILLEAPFERPKSNKVLLTIDLTPKVAAEVLSNPQTSVVVVRHLLPLQH
jgi:putative NIF3 family GTP cyclohydrolase 1 type 2